MDSLDNTISNSNKFNNELSALLKKHNFSLIGVYVQNPREEEKDSIDSLIGGSVAQLKLPPIMVIQLIEEISKLTLKLASDIEKNHLNKTIELLKSLKNDK